MTDRISLLLVDDQQLLREGMRLLLDFEEDIVVAGEAGSGREAVELYAELRPDVVFMDVQMPELDGIEATRRICKQDPQAKVIILTTFDDDEYIFEGIRAGALGYLLKAMPGSELAAAVRTVHQGGASVEPTVARKMMFEFSNAATGPVYGDVSKLVNGPISNRELEILRLLSKGCRTREIAQRLYLAEGTVRNYISTLINKLQVSDRAQVVARAKELGLA